MLEFQLVSSCRRHPHLGGIYIISSIRREQHDVPLNLIKIFNTRNLTPRALPSNSLFEKLTFPTWPQLFSMDVKQQINTLCVMPICCLVIISKFCFDDGILFLIVPVPGHCLRVRTE